MRVSSSTLLLIALLLIALLGCDTAPPGRVRSGDPARNFLETIRGTDVQFEMVWVPDGGFFIGKTEVTWDEYLWYCDFEKTGEAPPGVDGVTKPSKPLDDVSPYDRDWGIGRRPAVGMSLNAAKKYCEWLSINSGRRYRLPTEAEWELACGAAPRGGLAEHAWFEANSDEMTQEVGTKKPNDIGLHDMLGNLWEYCAGGFHADEPKRAVMRGGCWEDPAERVTPKSRLGFDDDWVLADPNVPPGVWWVPDGDHLGFRILCEVGATAGRSTQKR